MTKESTLISKNSKIATAFYMQKWRSILTQTMVDSREKYITIDRIFQILLGRETTIISACRIRLCWKSCAGFFVFRSDV